MRKRVVVKGNVRRSDYMRAVITDTLPEEVPIIFSNDGFYTNSSHTYDNLNTKRFIDAIFTPAKAYTKPYRYSVLRDAVSARGLSLLHPLAQKDVAKFYAKYDSLICHFCSKSDASLRSPSKVGGTFFVKGPTSEKNRYKAASVDTVSLATTVSNPASYFVYNKISRAHEFFDSNDYLHLEKRFSSFRSVDVSKCFNSIYTHTLYWAVDSIHAAKESNGSVGFANEFDKLMQSMNYNETNGICIGPEVSRIFAEVIFSEIDKKIIDLLTFRKVIYKQDYEFRRYVDDFYIFTHTAAYADKVTGAIATCLSKFNLHVNEGKTETIQRPFSTKRSRIISDANDTVSLFFDKIICYRTNDLGEPAAYPKKILRSDALIRDFIKRVKAICSVHETGYDSISDYVVSAASKRVTDLCDGFASPYEGPHVDEERYIAVQMLLIETIYFFYTVNPTVRASLYVARAVVTATRLFRDKFPERLPFLAESVVRWTIDLVRSIGREERHKDLTAIPLEVLNVLLPMKEIAEDEPLVDDLIVQLCSEYERFEYFEIVSFIFLFGGRSKHRGMVTKLFKRAQDIVGNELGPRVDAQSAHLVLDMLVCPFISIEKRAGWFNRLQGRCGLSRVSRQEAQAAIEDLAKRHWFVRWDRVDFLALLRKKELSAIY